MAGNSSGGMLYQEKKAPLEMKTGQREKEMKKGDPFLEAQGQKQGESLFSSKQTSRSFGAGPEPPVQEAPAHKFTRTLGKLGKKERTGTHSDVQREAFKKNLLDNIAMDMKGNYSAEFQYSLELLRQYALINITGDSDKTLLEQERSLLQTVVQNMTYLSGNLNSLGVRTQEQAKELNVLNLYLGYFSLDVNGYLQVPAAETATEKLEDYTGVTMKGTYKGWVQREDPENPGKMVNKLEDIPIVMKDVPKEQPLFPHEPSLNDIAQGGVGDCYLLAALSAVVNMNPQFIKDCMRDNGDGTVTVRFFEGPVDQKTAHYVKIKKAVPEGEPYAKGALWVQMIEHAYAASGLHIGDKNAPANQDKLLSYNNISSGSDSAFVETITGRRMTHGGTGKKLEGSSDRFFEDMTTQAMSQLQAAHPSEKSFTAGAATLAVLLGAENVSILDATSPTYADDVMEREQLYFAYKNFFDKMKFNIYSLEDAQEFFSKLDYKEMPDIPGYSAEKNLEIKKNFLEKMRDTYTSSATTPLQYRAFSGNYTEKAEEVYQTIQKAEEEGKIMTTGTISAFKSPEVVRGLNGEAMEIGLAASHAYTLLGVKQMGNNKYIKLRNPWSVGTRSYEQQTITKKVTRDRKDEGTHGIFLLELNEFMTHFESFSTL